VDAVDEGVDRQHLAEAARRFDHGRVVARTDLADNQYSSADPRLVLFNEVAGVGKTPFALHFNAAFNDPQSPWIQLFRQAVFEDADAAAIDQLNAGITSVLQGN
jgi:multiple sugar transport system substrate-binding protein